MKALIIGYGAIGKALEELIRKNLIQEPEIHDPSKGLIITSNWIRTHPIDVIHVCIPLKDEFMFTREILGYIYDFKPRYVIIHSTVLIRTCEDMSNYAKDTPIIHAPIRGNHSDLIKGMSTFPLFIGSDYNVFDNQELINYFRTLFPVQLLIVKSSRETALAKLLSVVWFGMNIAFAQEAKKICENHDIDFEVAYKSYFELDKIGMRYKKMNGKISTNVISDRPIFYPGHIGGKCVIQDVELLKPFGVTKELYDFILKSNEGFKDEND